MEKKIIKYVSIPKQVQKIKTELLDAVERVLLSGQYVLGEHVRNFEKEFSSYCNTKYSVGVANGTDAVHLLLKCYGIGPGDEVITCPTIYCNCRLHWDCKCKTSICRCSRHRNMIPVC